MTRQTLLYIIVLPALFVVIRYIRTARARQIVLLAVSYLLYASFGFRFLGLLVSSSIVNYLFGRWLRARQSSLILWLGIGANLALLATFKYSAQLLPFLHADGLASRMSQIALPIGISFWTFQALSYLIDTYRDEPLDPSLLEFLLYMSFWPTVLSGPICRLPNLLPQFRSSENSTLLDVSRGADRIGIGLLLVALSDILANGWGQGLGLNDACQLAGANLSGPDVWCLAFGFGFQLFFNFAGYSHIVIGSARLFGFTLAENFDRPYLSITPSEFWSRWHMSLSFWIRDYLFIPLATIYRTTLWRNVSLIVSMLIFGLWHRGTTLLAFWGIYQGILLVIHRQLQRAGRRWNWNFSGTVFTLICWLATIVSVNAGWILFRSENLPQAIQMLRSVAAFSSYSTFTLPRSLYLSVVILISAYFAVAGVQAILGERVRALVLPLEARVALYTTAIYLGILHSAQTKAFAYFKF